MKKVSVLLLCFIGLCCACSPKVKTSVSKKYDPLDYRQDVVVYALKETKPASAELLGTVKVGDAGMTSKCGYNVMLEEARMAARKMGGNAIKITSHKAPDFMSTCHRITAEILKIGDAEILASKPAEAEIDSTWNYALVYVYRHKGMGGMVSYNVHLGDSVICRVGNKFKQKIKITREGATELWAKTESKQAVPVNIQFGRTYYLRCGVSMGVMVGRPSLELVPFYAGKVEYESVNAKNK